jgi:5-methylcytosine-specific restriction endonuclease McrA
MSTMDGSDQHYALYGQTVMQRAVCPECGDHSLIVEGATLCCHANVEFLTNETKRMSRTRFVRRQPSAHTKQTLLLRQENRCYYCDRLWILRPTWDHYVPFAYCGSNPAENFVAACQVCNGYKSSMMFQTREEAQLYLRSRWGKEFGLEEVGVPGSAPS